MVEVLQSPLTELQLEILRLLAKKTSEEDLRAIKMLIVNYCAEKASKLMNGFVEKKGWSEEDLAKFSLENNRTKYI
jgi:hypothetical protein